MEAYDALILATGSTARKLPVPGADRPDLLELRTLEDAERLKAVLRPGSRLVIVGGGYVGLEAAASARALGAGVVVLERMDRVLARVASETLSTFFTDLHRARGVDIRTGVEVTAFEDGGVRLADGTMVATDVTLVGVGGLACDGLARTAGLVCENGVVVDATARTSDPSIYALGDITLPPPAGARRPDATAGKRAQRAGTGQTGGGGPDWPSRSCARGAVVLVGPV